MTEWIVASAVHFANYRSDWATWISYATLFQRLLLNGVWTRANRAGAQEN